MTLSMAQVRVLDQMTDGEWYSAEDLQSRSDVLAALHRRNLIQKRDRRSLRQSHRTAILYAITLEGRIALEEMNGD